MATSDECDIFTSSPQTYRVGHDFLGSVYVPDPVVRPTGALKALDPFTGATKWEFKYFSNPNGGVLSTAGGVVFAGESDGNFIALDGLTGKDLWHIQLGAAIYSTAITYQLDGKQYVVIPAGSALFAFTFATMRGIREHRMRGIESRMRRVANTERPVTTRDLTCRLAPGFLTFLFVSRAAGLRRDWFRSEGER